MTRQDEIKQCKADIKLLSDKILQLDILIRFAETHEADVCLSINASTMSEGVRQAAEDSTSSLSRTVAVYEQAIDYYERRIAVLQKLEREDKYGIIEKPEASKKKATRKKVVKSKVTFEKGSSDNQFKVFLDNQYIGVVRRSKVKYQSGEEIHFTDEAVKSRSFVKDGKLDIQAIAKFSQSKRRFWKFGTNDKTFNNHIEAAKALVREKCPEAKFTI